MTRAGVFARTFRRWLVVSILSSTAVAHAQVPGEEIARSTFEEGVALEKKGDFVNALTKFKESEQIKPTLGNRYHKAYCLEMTGKLAAALIEYEVLDKAAREAKKAELVEATRVRLEPLRTRVPQLAVKLVRPPSDAEVTLDGAALAPALLDGKAFRVDPGDHVIAARAPGHEPFNKSLNAGEGSTSTVEVTLKEAATTKSTDVGAATAPPPEHGSVRSRTLPIVTTAGAVVLAGAGVVAFIVAGQEQDDLKQKCSGSTSCDNDKGATRTLDALALGSWIGAATLAGLSLVLWTSSSPGSASAPRARLALRSSWVGLEGRF